MVVLLTNFEDFGNYPVYVFQTNKYAEQCILINIWQQQQQQN
jgi:hypothetical protein